MPRAMPARVLPPGSSTLTRAPMVPHASVTDFCSPLAVRVTPGLAERLEQIAEFAQVGLQHGVGIRMLHPGQGERGRRRHRELIFGHREIHAGADHDAGNRSNHQLTQNATDLPPADENVVGPFQPDVIRGRKAGAHGAGHREPRGQRKPAERIDPERRIRPDQDGDREGGSRRAHPHTTQATPPRRLIVGDDDGKVRPGVGVCSRRDEHVIGRWRLGEDLETGGDGSGTRKLESHGTTIRAVKPQGADDLLVGIHQRYATIPAQ